jgi:hypothetical protein
MEEVYYQDEYLTLYYNRKSQTARAVWNGFLSGDVLRNAVQPCIQLLETEQPINWLADNRKMKAIRKNDQEWIQTYMIPKIVASPLRKMATLISEDIFNQMAVESLYVKANNIIHFDHQYFNKEEAALAWLKETKQFA